MLALAVVLATLAATPAPKPAPKPAPSATPSVNGNGLVTKEFRIDTDETQSNYDTGDFTMPKPVKFFRPGTDVTGDSAKGNFKNSVVTITGHVVMHDDGRSRDAVQPGANKGDGPSTLTCDQLFVDSRNKVYICTGNLHYTQGPRSATADNGRLDQLAHALDLTGHVHVSEGGNELGGESVHYNTQTHDVDVTGNPMEIRAPLTNAPPAPKPTAKPKKK